VELFHDNKEQRAISKDAARVVAHLIVAVGAARGIVSHSAALALRTPPWFFAV
jgi:hypothetical protein